MYPLKNICVFGIGGVGGYFGGKIASAAKKEKEIKVSFIARGSHLEAIRENGLLLNTETEGGIVCSPDIATNSIADIPEPDLCLLCVKGYDLSETVKKISGKIREDTIIIPLLNGIDIDERVRENLKRGIVLPTCVYVSSLIEKPGIVTQSGKRGVILCGKDPNNPVFDPDPLIGFFERTHIDFQWADNPYPAIWEKYIYIAAFGLATASFDKTLGQVLSEKEPRRTAEEIMREVVLLAKQKGIELPENVIENTFKKAKNFPFESTTSFHRDVRAKRKSIEKDIFGGTVIRMGKEYGIPTPATCSAYATIEKRLLRTDG